MLFNIEILFTVYSLYVCFIKGYTIKSFRPKLLNRNKLLFNKNAFISFPDFPDDKISRVTKDIFDFNHDETLYTLIWYKCKECDNLLNDLKDANIKILYIDGSYYFFDEDELTNNPILYRNDDLIATDVFDIYEELFS